MKKTVTIIIPVYREENFIHDALIGIIRVFKKEDIDFEIISVIDTVPNDRTLDIVKELSNIYNEIKIIQRDGKQGIASAIELGIKKASKDIIVIAMGENSQDPVDLVLMAKEMNKGYDMVFGNRFINTKKLEKYPTSKLLANICCNWTIRLIFGIKSRDITNGIKAYNASLLKNIHIKSTGFEIFVELPIMAYLRSTKKISEIPIKYYGREAGLSKFILKKEGPKYLKIILICFIQKLIILF